MKKFIYLSIYLAALCMLSCESDSVNPQDEQMLIENELATSRGVEVECESGYDCQIIDCSKFYSSPGAICIAGVWEILEEFYWQYEALYPEPNCDTPVYVLDVDPTCCDLDFFTIKGCEFGSPMEDGSFDPAIQTKDICAAVNEKLDVLINCYFPFYVTSPCNGLSSQACNEIIIHPNLAIVEDPNYCYCQPNTYGTDRILIIESLSVYCCN